MVLVCLKESNSEELQILLCQFLRGGVEKANLDPLEKIHMECH